MQNGNTDGRVALKTYQMMVTSMEWILQSGTEFITKLLSMVINILNHKNDVFYDCKIIII